MRTNVFACLILAFVTFLLPFSLTAADSPLKEVASPMIVDGNAAADSLYMREDYAEALAHYQIELENTQKPSAALYNNMGCCYYRLYSVGEAVLFFERASRLSPKDADILHNLSLARIKTFDRIDTDALYPNPLWHHIASFLGIKLSLTLAITATAFLCFGIICFFLARSRSWRRMGLYIAMGMIPFIVFFNLTTWHLSSAYMNNNMAIVMSEESPVRQMPTGNATIRYTLHEGAKLRITGDAVGNWLPITIGTGKEGWISQGAISRIVP